MTSVIKRDGKFVPLPMARKGMAQLSRITGFVPRIIEIRPASTLPIFKLETWPAQNLPISIEIIVITCKEL